jgi:hypothetical protein
VYDIVKPKIFSHVVLSDGLYVETNVIDRTVHFVQLVHVPSVGFCEH